MTVWELGTNPLGFEGDIVADDKYLSDEEIKIFQGEVENEEDFDNLMSKIFYPPPPKEEERQ